MIEVYFILFLPAQLALFFFLCFIDPCLLLVQCSLLILCFIFLLSPPEPHCKQECCISVGYFLLMTCDTVYK